MDEKNLKKLWIISIFVILVLFSMYLVFSKEDKSPNVESSNQEKYSLVQNYNDFWTVDSCIYRFLTYVQGSNSDALMKVLSENYINNNNITTSNVLSKLNIISGNINFSSQKMFVEEVNKNISKYYVFGFLERDIMDDFPQKYDTYYIVILDKNEKIFSIEPYDGKIFR